MKDVVVKRVYDAASPRDGVRVLVDRVWPRGMTKEALAAALWLKDIAPSTALRKWYGHEPSRWEEFRRRYLRELETKDELVARLREEAGGKRLTLLYSARDPERNQAVVLRDYLLSRAGKR